MYIVEKVLKGKKINREDIIYLLELPCDSKEVQIIGEYARKISREVASNKGKVWGAIGLDYSNCKMNCSFCSLGEKWSRVSDTYELTEEEIMHIAKNYINSKVDFFVLRTTEFYEFEKLIEYVKIIKEIISDETFLL